MAAAVLATVAATACNAGPTAGGASHSRRTSPLDVAAARLSDAGRISSGDLGFFADKPRSAAESPWSLTTTYWNSLYGATVGLPLAGTSAPAVNSWVKYGWTAELPTSGLPAMTQIAYAAAISEHAGRSVPWATLRRSLSVLRTRTGYKFDRSDNRTDPAATALALETRVAAGTGIPRGVRTALAREIRGLESDRARWNAREVRTSTLSVLAAGTLGLHDSRRRREVADLAQRATNVLGAASVSVIDVGLVADLKRAVRAAGARQLRVPESLCRVARAAAADGDQAQFAYYSVELGCAPDPTFVIDPPSRSGWVEPAVVQGNPGYLDASRVAMQLPGVRNDALARTQMVNWFKVAWSRADKNQFTEYSRLRLADELDISTSKTVRVPQLTRVSPASSLLAAMQSDLLTHGRATDPGGARRLEAYAERLSRTPLSRMTILDAAALRATAEYFTVDAWGVLAVRAAENVRTDDGLYALQPGSEEVIALSAALGAWIVGDPLTYGSLEQRGICRSGGCAPQHDPRSFVVSLSTTQMLASACKPDVHGQRLPIFVS